MKTDDPKTEEDDMKLCILTGATGGLGREFCKLLKGEGFDRIWLVSRSADALAALAAECEGAEAVPIDLTDRNSIYKIADRLREEKPEIKALINNAGFGFLGDVADMPFETQADTVRLNCEALTALTGVCLPYMKEGSYIINVCSIASFAPNTRMTTYSATKAYVSAFNAGLRAELKKRKINALAVNPGPMDTKFLTLGNIKGNSRTFETLPYCDPAKVAAGALRAAKKGRGNYTPRFFFKFYRVVAKVLPRSLVMKMAKT